MLPPVFRSDWLLVPLSLFLAATLVVSGIVGYYYSGNRYQVQHGLTWPGQPFGVAAGEITAGEEGITVSRLDARGRGIIRLVGAVLDASRYDRLRLETSGLSPDIRLGLVWRDVNRRDGGRVFWLPRPDQGPIDLSLAEQSWWRGGLADLALMIQGPPQESFTIHRIDLQATQPTSEQFLTQLWQEWTLFSGWTQRSINFLPAGKRHGLISPVLTIAIWVLVSTLLYVAIRWRLGGKWRFTAFVAPFMMGWVLLDARWQWEIAQQLDITRQKYAGKDSREKRLVSEDGQLFLLAEEVKKVIPVDEKDLSMILPNSWEKDKYLFYHMRYYLSPLRLRGGYSELTGEETYPGVYILILTGNKRVRWDKNKEVIQQGDMRVAAEQILTLPFGNLYRTR
jgi:hypothetical protein